MPGTELRRPRRRAVRLALALLCSLLATPLISAGNPTAGAADALPYTLEVTPATGLVDGQTIAVAVRAVAGKRIGISGLVWICRDGPTYTTASDLLPYVGGNCPDKPVSSSASGPWPIRPYPDGSVALGKIHVGTGTVEWGPATDPTKFDLTCDSSNPCRLVVQVPIEGGQQYIDSSTLLTFGDDNPVSSCGGSDGDAVRAGGPDRLLTAWVDWTVAQCVAESKKAATQAVLTGEGAGHDAFANDQVDFTYSAVGSRYPGRTPTKQRASVSVPIALNAVVVGVLGGHPTDATDWPSGVPQPYDDLAVTVNEMADLFGQGPFSFSMDYLEALKARNAELASADSLANSDRPNPLAPAGSDGVTWFATNAFDSLAPDQWRTSPMSITGNPPDVDRGPTDDLALADPPFVNALFELYSSKATLRKLVAENEFKPYNYGPIWVLTDLATATELGIPTVAVQNKAGEYVAPTESSLKAAAADMAEQADGAYLPDLATPSAGAYPLTFAEHAVAPAEPLLDADCKARTGAQAALARWLTYITGNGQGSLAPGLVPLTPDMFVRAQVDREKVGKATPTGACAPKSTPTTTTTTTTTPGTATTVPDASGDFPTGLGGIPGSDIPGSPDGSGSGIPTGDGGNVPGSGDGSGDGTGSKTTRPNEDDVELVASLKLPGVATDSGPSWTVAAGSFVGLALLVGLGGAVSSGRRPSLRRRKS